MWHSITTGLGDPDAARPLVEDNEPRRARARLQVVDVLGVDVLRVHNERRQSL